MLDKVQHKRIIDDIERVCVVAGVQERFLHESMTKHCDSAEVDWVRNFQKYRVQGMPGLVLENIQRPDARCQAMAAALVRNYIDARVIPLNTLIDERDEMGSPTVLFVPNLFMEATSKNMVPWRVQVVYDILLERSVKGKPTVVYVESLDGLVKVYGQPFRDFLANFRVVH